MSSLAPVDWAIVLAYCVLSVGIGIYFSRRGGRSTAEFFGGGRSFPWWLAGTSMVATTFAADTPLAVAGLVRKQGIAGNWLWWTAALGGLVGTFLYARLWRRTEVLTDLELIEIRYQGRGAQWLRILRVAHTALIVNAIVMGWVFHAMAKILAHTTGWNQWQAVAALTALALSYSILSGLWGVVATDLVQFTMAMCASVLLAVYAVREVGGLHALTSALHRAGLGGKLSLLPHADGGLALKTFVVYLCVQWWATGRPDGEGYVAQRLLATRGERDAFLAMLWFNFAHYVLRPWPWILVGLASLLVLPHAPGGDNEAAYPVMMSRLLPPGALGLMLASLVAAFMSTIDTQLNWAASYLVNDLYRPFVRPGASERHYVCASRWAVVFVLSLGVTAAFVVRDISVAWKLLIAINGGTGLVYLLRWFWRRINAWSEIAAMLGSLVTTAVLMQTAWRADEAYAERLVTVLVCATVCWLAVTLLTPPVDASRWRDFVAHVHPGATLRQDLVGWGMAACLIYGGLFAVGGLLLGRWSVGGAAMAVALLGAWGVRRHLRQMDSIPSSTK